jgi:hypothetical protein
MVIRNTGTSSEAEKEPAFDVIVATVNDWLRRGFLDKVSDRLKWKLNNVANTFEKVIELQINGKYHLVKRK